MSPNWPSSVRRAPEVPSADRETSRVLLHVDLDAFFAAAEEAANPTLRGKPIVVGGRRGSRGVVSTANYEARKYGIHSAMPLAEAERKCPHAIFLPGNPDHYVYLSLKILEIYRGVTPLLEPLSVDEAILEVTGRAERLEEGAAIAREIQSRIHQAFELTASIGVAHSRYLAKMGAGLEKPNGVTILTRERFVEIFHDKPVSSLWGVGEKTEQALHRVGISSVGALSRAPLSTLQRLFGVLGEQLRLLAQGIDHTAVRIYTKPREVKSVGHEHTFGRDTNDPLTIRRYLRDLSDRVGRRLRIEGFTARTLTLKIRLTDFTTYTRAETVPGWIADEWVIFDVVWGLLRANWDGETPLRLLGVSASSLASEGDAMQVSLFSDSGEERRRKVVGALDAIRDKYGEGSITRGLLVHGPRPHASAGWARPKMPGEGE